LRAFAVLPYIRAMDEPVPERVAREREFWETQARWNARIAIYDTPEVRDPARAEQAFERSGLEAARHLARFLHPEARALDLGCGIGRVMRPLAAHCREITGVDISTEMLAQASDYLHGAPNARLVRTDGRSLPGVADGSIDFLYSLLCFIHVDKRTAFRYFQEIRRVLAPGGRAFLQLEDILSEEGLRRFVEVVPREDPLEFYAEAELVAKLGALELEVLDVLQSGGYLFATVGHRADREWRSAFREAVAITAVETSGWLGEKTCELSRPATVRARVQVRSPGWWTASPFFALAPRGGAPDGPVYFRAQAVTPLRGPGEHALELLWRGDTCAIELDGRPAAFLDLATGDIREGGEATLHMGLLPAGLRWEARTLADFPALFSSRDLRVL
jgi:SAM-dependent methyltransferase